MKGGHVVAQQMPKTLCLGILAHVDADRGVPHFYSPEKFEFLGAFCLLLYIMPSNSALR